MLRSNRLLALILLFALLIAGMPVATGTAKDALAARVIQGHDLRPTETRLLATENSGTRRVRFETVKFLLHPPGTPTLYLISNSDGDGNYTVDWSGMTGATSYELQERYNEGSWDAVYTGSSSQYSRSNQSLGEWCYRALASNNFGSSDWSNTECTTVHLNHPPQALNVTITPTAPTDHDSLTLTYVYSDTDGNPEGDTRLRWYRNDVLQPAFNDQDTISSSVTLPGELWCTAVTPRDGFEYGTTVEDCVYIESAPNHPPQALDVTITPTTPTDYDSLTLTYVYSDTDGNPEGDTQVRWYRNGMLQPAFSDEDTVPSTATYLGETWCATVRPHDGVEYGPVADSNCVIIRTLGNHLPQALNPAIEPTEPETGDDLMLTYVYTDTDGDLEDRDRTQLRWYRDGVLQPAFNDQTLVQATDTLPGESWHATVRPHDGHDYGLLVKTAPVWITEGITNTPPEVRDVHITPAQPVDDDHLYLIYTYLDADGDTESDTQIQWYRNMVHQDAYDGQTAVPANATAVDDVWYATVTPHDGQDYGDPIAAHSVSVGQEPPPNTPPKALNVYLTPDQPGDDDQLELHYDYYDADGDPGGATQIRWTTDGQPQPAFDDRTVVPADATSIGETWCATVTPHDGEMYGDPVSPECGDVGDPVNTPPEALQPHIEPCHPISDESMTLSYIYFDLDYDPEGDTEIRWYRDTILQSAYNDKTSVPALDTSPGESWYATIRPHDGQDYGTLVSAPAVKINHPPQAQDVHILPTQPDACQALWLHYVYEDGDDDPANESQIRWYCNDAHRPDHDDEECVPASATSAGQSWYATVAPYDSFEYGYTITATTVVISDSPCKLPTYVYLPLLLRDYANLPYEENDKPKQAYGPLIPGRPYDAYPEDTEDWYYFVLHQTTSVSVRVTDYNAVGGHLLVYDQTTTIFGFRARNPNKISRHPQGGSTS